MSLLPASGPGAAALPLTKGWSVFRAGRRSERPVMDLICSRDARPFFAVAALLGLWGCSILMFGIPGLYIPAVCMVPVVFALLIAISAG